jgi:hypothetical protein
MAVTRGYVQQVSWLSGTPLACMWVGSDAGSSELVFIQIRAPDSAVSRASKRAMIGLLVQAQLAGREVDVVHPDDSAEVTSVATTTCDVAVSPVQMDAIEVTQAIQDLSLSVPLVAGKQTVVRVYLSNYGASGITVRGSIRVRRGPSDPPLTIASLNTAVLDPTQAGNVAIKRTDASRSLNFMVPYGDTAAGPLAISLTSVTDVGSGNPVSVGCGRRPTVWFHPSPPLRVRVLAFRYRQGTPPVTYTPSALDFDALLSWLGRAYPVGQVLSSTGTVDAAAAPPFGCGDINSQLAAIRALDVTAGTDQRTHYYGLVSDGGFFMRGCAGVPSTPDPSAVGSGPTGPGTYGWDFDGTYGDWYGGHELGHTFGRRHPGFCGESPDDLTRYPYANGQLANSDASFVGLDTGDPTLNFPMTALTGTQWHDVMTYCDYQWLSAYTYQGVRLRLLDEDALGAGTGGGGGAPSPGTGGRPDERYPQLAQRAEEEARPGETAISVVGTVNLTREQGKLQFVNPVPGSRPSGLERDSPVMIRVQSAVGTNDYPVAVKLSSELSPGDDRTGIVDAVIPVATDAGTIELLIGGKVVDTFMPGPPPPAVRAIRPLEADDKDLKLALEFDRPLDPSHSYAIQISTDHGRTWQTLGVGMREPTLALDRSHFERTAHPLVRVIATNGFSQSITTSEPLRMPGGSQG